VCNIARIMTVSGKSLRRSVGAILGVFIATAPGWSGAADVKGRVTGYEHLRNPVWIAAKDPDRHGYSFREPVTTVPAAMRKLFPQVSKEIMIVALGTGPKGPGKAVSVRVSGGRTTPVTLVITPGTEIRFKNADPFDHRLYAVGLATFPASNTAKGALRRWTPQEVGRYELRDELAPSLSMWVVTEPTVVAAALPTTDGRFTLNIEESGQYTLQAYFAGEAVGRPLSVNVERRDVDVSGRPLVLASKPPVEDNNP
jgi:plastocyanin